MMARGDLVTIVEPDGTRRHYLLTDTETTTAETTTLDLLADPTEEDA